MNTSLYIHIPFCLNKCLYCDFVSYPYNPGDVPGYLDALGAEIKQKARLAHHSLAEHSLVKDFAKGDGTDGGETLRLESIYIGGGTPTCLGGESLAGIIRLAGEHFFLQPGAEITVEANPGTINTRKLELLLGDGVNRLSIGLQSCDDDKLKILGRVHNFKEGREAFFRAREAGFQNISIDLMYGIPGQTPGQWRQCLERVLELAPEHISAYGLTLEEGTPLLRMVEDGQLNPCPEDDEAEMFEAAMGLLGEAGYGHYEISNFALPGRECRHNLRYWHNLSYLGAGAAAVSYIGGRRLANEANLLQYTKKVLGGESPVSQVEEADRATTMAETIFLALRLNKGLNPVNFMHRFGQDINDIYKDTLSGLRAKGLLEYRGGNICLTARGLMLGNTVFAAFMP